MSEAGPISDLAESPVFNDIEVASFSFAFELYPEKEDRQAFRLEQVGKRLETEPGTKLRKALIEPFSSYLDDVTTGRPGRHGRPLIFLAEAPKAGLAVTVRRDAAWVYEAEGAQRRLHGGGDGDHELLLREAFCAFKSGRIFYIVSLALPEAPGRPIDEYLVIQMQRQAMNPATATGLSFVYPGNQDGSLLGLARTRLRELAADVPGRDAASGLFGIIGDDGLLSAEEIAGLDRAINLSGLCVAIENKGLMETVDRACRKFGHGQAPEAEDAAHRPGLVRKLVRSIMPRDQGDAAPAYPLHNDSEDRALYALSGLAQGVADFGSQDPAELSDATCPANRAAGYALYAHPAFMLEIAPQWRSLVRCRDSVGTCPYLMLIWLTAIHADLLVSELEDGIDDMVYLHGEDEAGYRSDPLADLHKALKGSGNPFAPGGEQLLHENLKRRLTLVGTALMHQSSALFRYPKEKGDLAAALQVMGTAARSERAQLLLDKIEDLVEDVISLRRSYADQRTNSLLLAISLLSILSVTADVRENFNLGFAATFLVLIAAVLAVVAALRFGPRWFQDSRSRKSS